MSKELIRLRDLTMEFDGERILDSINLYINDKEFLTLLGPSGCGKTTLANIIALRTNGEFIKLNAVNAGVADVKKAVETARDNLKLFNKRTYLLLDECHRFNKTQSDSLLPSIALASVTSSAYSKSAPTGKPNAILDTFIPNGLISLVR